MRLVGERLELESLLLLQLELLPRQQVRPVYLLNHLVTVILVQLVVQSDMVLKTVLLTVPARLEVQLNAETLDHRVTAAVIVIQQVQLQQLLKAGIIVHGQKLEM